MDWNNDGNHDCHDDAYYNNVIGGGSSGSCGIDGWKFYVIAFVIYIISKLMGA